MHKQVSRCFYVLNMDVISLSRASAGIPSQFSSPQPNKAPGFCRPKKLSSAISSDAIFDVDYERKKLLASKGF